MLYWMSLLSLLSVLSTSVACAQRVDPTARARELINLLAKGDFASAHSMLDSEMAAKLPTEKLEQVWQTVQKQVGAYKASTGAREERSETSHVVFLTCEFARMSLDARIPLGKDGKVSGLSFTQHADYLAPDYVKTDSFREQEVTVGTGEWAVHGTLAIPAGKGPFPAVTLVQGSGNSDRDSSLGPNKIFRDIAWGLASRGVAVLRYNKRANEHPEAFGKLTAVTVKEENMDDALSACALLRATPGIDSKRIFLLGHSLGGTVAPRIASADQLIAGVIILGGTSLSLLDKIVPQLIQNFTLHGPMSAAQQKTVDQMRHQVAHAKDPALAPDAPRSEMPLGVPASYWIDVRDYHPAQLARTLKQPILVLQGERDYQVTMDDFENWKKTLADRPNVEFRSYPSLNHMFFAGEGVSSDEEYVKPGHVATAVVVDIAAWINGH